MLHRIPRQIIEGLRKVPLFSGCTVAELRSIATLGTETSAVDGQVLTEQGKPGHEFCLIRSGRVRCSIDGKQVAVLEAGDFFGEMALLDHGPRHATVVAYGPVQLLVLDAREFRALLDDAPSIARKLLFSFAARERMNASVRS